MRDIFYGAVICLLVWIIFFLADIDKLLTTMMLKRQ